MFQRHSVFSEHSKIFNKSIPIFNWSEGALFAIKGKYIKNHPKEFYIRLKTELFNCKTEDLGFLYERLWSVFFFYY